MPGRASATRSVEPPRLPAQLDALTAEAISGQPRLDRESTYRGLHLISSTLRHADAELVELHGCRFDRVDLSFANLERAVVTDCLVERCDLANLRLGEATVTRAQFTEVRMTGGQWVGSVATDVGFDGSRALGIAIDRQA